MKLDDFDIAGLIDRLNLAGHGDDLAWSESCTEPTNAEDFALETVFVICNSGMRFIVASGIYRRVRGALRSGRSASTEFGHDGKAAAIDLIWRDRDALFAAYKVATDKLEFLESLPWIGKTTKFHLAKNFGMQYAKPDVHLVRLANTFESSPQALCEALSQRTGLKVATIDTLLWRGAAIGVLDTSTGKLISAAPGQSAD